MLKTEEDMPGDSLQIQTANYVYMGLMQMGADKRVLDTAYQHFMEAGVKSTRVVDLPFDEERRQIIFIYMN